MINSQFEKQLRDNAEAVFGQGRSLPVGHRERFEQRLKSCNVEQKDVRDNKTLISRTAGNSGKFALWKTWVVASVVAAAVFAGLAVLLNPFAKKSQRIELAELCYYYNIQLEEQAAYTRQLIKQVDETNRGILFANVDYIENEPIPDVQLSDDDLLLLIIRFYENKIETLQNIQDLIWATDIKIN